MSPPPELPIAVTGATGLIGREIRRQLAVAGRPVVPLDVTDGGDPAVRTCDLRDAAAVFEACRTGEVGSIIHCGGISGAMVAVERPRDIVDINVGGTANVLEAARLLAVRRVVFTSTAMVYGETGGRPIDESTPLAPTSMYAATKAAAEHLVTGYRAEHGVAATSARISWVYGPHRTTDCFIRDALVAAASGTPFRRDFGRGHPRQFVHVRDVAAALLVLHDVDATPPAAVYNVSGREPVTLDEVARIVAERHPGADLRLGEGPDPDDVTQGPIDISRIARDVGFAPTVDLRSGIDAYAAWLGTRTAAVG